MTKRRVIGCGLFAVFGIAAAILVGLYVITRDSGEPPLHPDDLAQWKRVDVESPPVLLEVPLDDATNRMHIAWATDSGALSWIARSVERDVLKIIRLDTEEPRTIPLNDRVRDRTHLWYPDNQRVQVGLYTQQEGSTAFFQRRHQNSSTSGVAPYAGPDLMFDVELAEVLRVYDIDTGAMEREYTAAGILHTVSPRPDGGMTPAHLYGATPSPDGQSLLVQLIAPKNPKVALVPTDYYLAVLTGEDTGRVLAHGKENAWPAAQWFAPPRPTAVWHTDGAGVLIQQDANEEAKLFDSVLDPLAKKQLIYRPLDGASAAIKLATYGSTVSGIQAYPEHGGTVRFCHAVIKPFGISWDWSVHEYRFDTGERHNVLGVKTILDQVYEETWHLRRIQFPERSSDRLLVSNVRGNGWTRGDTWLFQLAPERVLARLNLPDPAWHYAVISPDGTKLAAVAGDRVLRVYNLDAALADDSN